MIDQTLLQASSAAAEAAAGQRSVAAIGLESEARFINLLGGASVQVPAPEMREALAKGTADITQSPWESLYIFGADSIVTHHLDMPVYAAVNMFVINRGVMDAMAPEDRQVMEDHCTPEAAEKMSSGWADVEAAGRDKIAADPKALKPLVDEAKKANKPMTFAMTFPPGTHAMWMRYFLGAGGIHPDKDVALVTIPGITQLSRDEWGTSWYWRFTPLSARRLFEGVFPAERIELGVHGNVLAATAFLQGISAAELEPEELGFLDPRYDVVITVRATKPPA